MNKNSKNQQEKWLKMFGAENTYNIHCGHICQKNDEYYCEIHMEMLFCTSKCAYATNSKGTLKVDKKGKVIGVRK